jgi:adenosylhomocysteine nucleosidase
MSTIVIIAALERELAPLVRTWQMRRFCHDSHSYRVHEHEDLVAVAGGIGHGAASRAAHAMIARYRPQLLISVGVAGSLHPGLKAGTVFVPNLIFNSQTEAAYLADCGSGVLVTSSEIVVGAARRGLAVKFHAAAVDMEAAAVAEAAQQQGIGFRCVKAISDEADFAMPPLDQFVDEAGQFNAAKFVLWATIRPNHWPGIVTLARNTKRAARALGAWLAKMPVNAADLPLGKVLGKTTKVLDV